MRNPMSAMAAAVAAIVLAFAAWASDPMAGTFGNKVLVTNAAGEVTTYWFKADKTVKIKGAKGEEANATWEISADGKQICLTAVLPAGAKAPEGGVKPVCSEFVGGGKKPGDKWQQKDAEGKPITVEIVAGM
jgi:hypothetical protein